MDFAAVTPGRAASGGFGLAAASKRPPPHQSRSMRKRIQTTQNAS
jgi:hypothetical protein